ncbi:DoxX family protein [Streptomyces sp. NPDC090088]|uniref:DoxX family protein n=1 Tax=Streptomyces sp. NPDC090088 TaxID=3365944 RepID=UPI00381B2994
MYITAATLSVLLTLITTSAGVPKVRLKGASIDTLQSHMGLSPGAVRLIGLAEIAAAAGLVVGLFWQPLGIAAATGFAVLTVGAAVFHGRAGDFANPDTRANAIAPVVFCLLSVAAAVTLTLAM